MKEIINVFSRHEIKYMITDKQRKEILRGIKDRMIPDPHGLSTICNMYYDTPDHRLIRKSLDKPVYKEKMRVRSYGRAKEDTIVFLELKKKYDGVVYKRRIELKEKDATAYMEGKIGITELIDLIADVSDPQIAKEIDYFKNYYEGIKPSVYLSYDRCAYFSEEDESLRITFDKNIRWRKNKARLTDEPGGEEILPEGASLMEIKTATALPVWLVEVLSKAEVRPSGFSKYGKAYQAILAEELAAASEVKEAVAKAEEERMENNNDKYDRYILKRVLRKRSYDTRLRNKSGSSAGTGSLSGAGVFLSQGPF